jgi:thioester reductase-like protein
MSTNCYFVTGFPGFISSNLLHRLAKLHVGSRFLLLVLPEQIAKARSQVETLAKTYSESTFEIIHGDITKADLGIAPNEYTNIRESITHVIHLAAIYDLAVPDHVSHKVNVLGTDNVNKFVLSLTALKRYVYFSTAYVSGKRRGKILETDLDFNQSFKNYYELSKFRAEKLVQEIMSRVPTTIIRPSVVVGDSKTGETAKFDGPYFVMGFLNRFKRLPLPFIG